MITSGIPSCPYNNTITAKQIMQTIYLLLSCLMAFYDALTKPRAIKEFYENEELVNLTKELTDTLRKNKTIDWQKKESARAKMRSMVRRLLKKYGYPPEGREDAVETVMVQCELWTDNELSGDMNPDYLILAN